MYIHLRIIKKNRKNKQTNKIIQTNEPMKINIFRKMYCMCICKTQLTIHVKHVDVHANNQTYHMSK